MEMIKTFLPYVLGLIIGVFILALLDTGELGFNNQKVDDVIFSCAVIFVTVMGIILAFKAYKLIFSQNVIDKIAHAKKERQKSKAHGELLKLKKLFDSDIITKEEFDTKAKSLKKSILD
jgi:uncharacterized protein YacL